MSQLFNIASLSLKDSGVIHLRHPVTDEQLYVDEAKTKPIEIVVYSSASKQYRDYITAMQNRHLKRDKKKITAEVMQEENIELITTCSIKANNFKYNSLELTTPDAFRTMYRDASLSWVKDQVEAFLGDTASFLEQ